MVGGESGAGGGKGGEEGGAGGGHGGACVPDPTYMPVIDPARFPKTIDNPLLAVRHRMRPTYAELQRRVSKQPSVEISKREHAP